MYPGYPDPMPAFQYQGGDFGKGLLESALSQPKQTFSGRFLYRTMPDKAAAMLVSMIKNHPFVDGNKRMALTATTVFLILNDWVPNFPQKEAVQLCLDVASAKGNVKPELVAPWFRKRARSLDAVLKMHDEYGQHWDSAVEDHLRLLKSLSRLYQDLAGPRKRRGKTRSI